MERLKTSGDFSFVFFRTLPGLNFAVIENCTFQNVKGPLCTTYQGMYSFQTQQSIFCIFASFFTFYQFFCLYLYKESERKTTTGLYVVEGSLPDFQPVPLAFQLGSGSQIQKASFL
jgi:hypothetical protein